MSIRALEHHLKPLQLYLNGKGVTEICINQPGQIFVERQGQFNCHKIEKLSYDFLEGLANLVAEFNHKDFPAPLLSGSLPTGERVQFVMSPACVKGKIILAIRKPHRRDLSLEDYEEQGAFIQLIKKQNNSLDEKLKYLYQTGDILNFIKAAIVAKKNILISGGTGTGKTTFLNACLKMIPDQERLITLEDTHEVIVKQPNVAHLLFNEDDEAITSLKLFRTCLRLRPDRIFLSELRGAEVWPYLRATNSGHPGSLSTVHADTPEAAFTQLVFMMQQAGSTSKEEQIRAYIKSIINIVIQLKRDPTPDRFMSISEIYYAPTFSPTNEM